MRREHVLGKQCLAGSEHTLADRDRTAHDINHARHRGQRQHAPIGQEVLDEP
jgi:hypothetical protein